jgi:hypothetical protein
VRRVHEVFWEATQPAERAPSCRSAASSSV